MDAEMFINIENNGIDLNVVSFLVDKLSHPIDNFLQHKERKKKTRNDDYFEVTVPRYSNDLFREHFRMSRITFENLMNVIGHALHNDILLSVNLEKKMLYSLWLLAKQESFLAVGDRFGIPKSSGHAIFKQITDCLAGLMPNYISWPLVQNYAAISNVFETRSGGFPGIIGAIDGCHIQCKQPPNNPTDYYNRKGVHSIILQGTCDHKGRFIDCFIGMPGRLHDARVFRNSPVFRLLTSEVNPLLPSHYHLIGDSAYPLLQNLMTPFRDNGHLTDGQTHYNIALNSVRSIIERSFGLLKGKFRRLKYLDVNDFEVANRIIASACVLHNFIIDNDDINLEGETWNEMNENGYEGPQPQLLVNNEATIKRNRIVTLFE